MFGLYEFWGFTVVILLLFSSGAHEQAKLGKRFFLVESSP